MLFFPPREGLARDCERQVRKEYDSVKIEHDLGGHNGGTSSAPIEPKRYVKTDKVMDLCVRAGVCAFVG